MADFNAEELPTVQVVETTADEVPAEENVVTGGGATPPSVLHLGDPGYEVFTLS